MPRQLLEANEYTPYVFMPLDGELAGEITLQQIFQGFANRTAWLKGQVDTFNQLKDAVDGLGTGKLSTVAVAGALTGTGKADAPVRLKPDAEAALSRVNAFAITSNGLTVTVGAGRVAGFADGAYLDCPGGPLTLPPNETVCIVLDLGDGALHMLPRAIHSGAVLLATLTTDGAKVTSVKQPGAFLAPRSRLERTKRRLRGGIATRLALLGDSLTENAGTAPFWPDLLFDAGQVAQGFNVPNTGQVERANHALGGSTVHFALAITGRAVQTYGFSANGTAAKLSPAASALLDPPTELHESPVLSRFDVAWIAAGANGGQYRTSHLETVVRNLRARGAEVLIGTQNNRTDNLAFGADLGDVASKLAETYGCSVVDTWAYVREAQWLGRVTHADVIHMNAEGHRAYARAMRGVWNDRAQFADFGVGAPLGRVIAYPENLAMRKFPSLAEVQVKPTSTSGTAVADNVTRAEVSPGKLFGGLPAATCMTQLTAGQSATYCHPHAHGFDILADRDTAWTLEVRAGGQVLDTIVNAGLGYRNIPALETARGYVGNWGDIAAGQPGYKNGYIELACTAGTVRLAGVSWHTWPSTQIDSSRMIRKGTWVEGAEAPYGYPTETHTDTLNDSISIPFTGTGIQVLLAATTAGGIVKAWLDGRPLPDLDLYAGGAFTRSIDAFEGAASDRFDLGYGEHVLRIKYVANNPNVTAPAAGQRRLMVVAAYAFDGR